MTSASNLGIGITMFLRDEFSGPAAKIAASAAKLKTTAQDIYEDQLRYTRNLSAGMAMIGGTAIAGLGRAIKKGAEFQYQMEFTGIVTGATAKQTEELTNQAQKLSTQYSFTADQIAAGMKEMGKAGMGVEETSRNISAAIDLAVSTDTELAKASDMMISVMKQWRMGFEESARVADMMAYAVNQSVIEMPDLAESMKYAVATAIDVGAAIEELTGMIMNLGQQGIKGSMAGVAIENALRYIGRAIGKSGTDQQKRALQEIGITMEEVQDQAGNMLPLVTIFDNIAKAINRTFGPEMGIAKQNVLTEIFGVRGKRAASATLRTMEQLSTYTRDLTDKSTGFAATTSSRMMETTAAKLARVSNAWKQLGTNFAEAITPILNPILDIARAMGNMVSWLFKVPILKNMLAGGIAGFLVIKTLTMAWKALMSGILLIQKQITAQTVAQNAAIGQSIALTNTQRAAMTATNMQTQVIMSANTKKWGYNPNLFRGTGGYYMMAPGGGMRMAKSQDKMAGMVRGAYGKGAMLKGGMGVLGGVMGRLTGLLGGPFGIAMAFILPGAINALIGAIKKNKGSTDENTRALKDKAITAIPDANARVVGIEFMRNSVDRMQAMKDLSFLSAREKHGTGPMDSDVKQLIKELADRAYAPIEPITVVNNMDSVEISRQVLKHFPRYKISP